MANHLAGTPGYIDPIILNAYLAGKNILKLYPDKNNLLKTDLFSVGATIYYLLCGEPMIDGNSTEEILAKTEKFHFDLERINIFLSRKISKELRDFLK